MAEFVVARPAERCAALAVVVLVALDTVAITQRLRLGAVRVFFPRVRRVHPALRRHLHDQRLVCTFVRKFSLSPLHKASSHLPDAFIA